MNEAANVAWMIVAGIPVSNPEWELKPERKNHKLNNNKNNKIIADCLMAGCGFNSIN